MKKPIFIMIMATLFSIEAFASLRIADTVIGVGNLTQFVGKVQKDTAGSTRKFEFHPYISIAASWEFAENWTLLPELGIALPQKTPDDNVSSLNYFLMAIVGYNFHDWVFRGGLGISYNKLSSDGGTAVVNNGNGSDAFFLPTESSTSSNLIANIGAEYFFHRIWSGRLDTHIFNVFDSKSRGFSYTGSVHYHFGEFNWD